MPQPYDWPLEQLRTYQPELTKQADFAVFWSRTLVELAQTPLEYRMEPYDYPVRGVKVYNLRYRSYRDATIEAWLVLPDGPGPHPGLVLFHGYNWAFDGKIHDTVNLALHGYACFQLLVRGQQGHSEDNIGSPAGHPVGWLTQGIADPAAYYYRAVYMDAVRALQVLATIKTVDPNRIGVMGGSQGGGLALAGAALSDIPRVAVVDFPFLANFERAIDIAPGGPYYELNEYFRRNSAPEYETAARRTLSYFDLINHAPQVRCYTLMTMGLIDQTTPPSTVSAVYNHLRCAKDLMVWRYFGHEVIPGSIERKLRTLLRFLQAEPE